MSRDTPPMDDKDEHIRQLDQRVNELEATIKQMLPSRRDALKLGGAAALGAAAMSGSASAGSSQVGTIGTSSDRVDINAEDINNADSLRTGTFEATNQPSARVFASSSQTLSGLTKVAFDSVDFDDRNDFDTSQHVYVVPIAGTYLVSSTVRMSNLNDGERLDIFLRLNDTSNISGFRREIGGGEDQMVRHTAIHSFSANDELQIEARKSGTGDGVVETGSANSYFQIHKLA